MTEMPHDNADNETYGDSQTVDDSDQLQPYDTLDNDDVDDVLDRGLNPPDRPPAGYDDRPTGAEMREGESLDKRLAQEEPEPDPYAEAEAEQDEGDENALPEEAHDHDAGVLPDERAGRLVQPDEGGNLEDHDQAEIATDVGIDGAAASAEEAAVHVVDDVPGGGQDRAPE
jgi:hypothetical protein